MPIYQGGAEEATVRQAKELHAQAATERERTDRQVRDAVSLAWNTFQAAQASIASNQATAKADEIAFRASARSSRSAAAPSSTS